MSRRLLIALLLLLVVAAGAFAGYQAPQPQGAVTISIIHTNDMHGYIEPETVTVGRQSYEKGGMANLVGWIDQWRAQNAKGTLVLDAGDIWQGTFVSNQSQGQIMIDIMNIAGYAAAAPGNHDFDMGADVLQARVAQARFPFLAANIVEETSGKIPSWLKPYTILPAGGLRIGVIGLGYPGTPAIVKPSSIKGLRFLPAAPAVRSYLDTVRKQSDIVVVLSHLGIFDDGALAAEVPGIDVIVGGHTHTVQTKPKKVGDTIIVQAGSHAKHIGKLDLTYDRVKSAITSYTQANEVIPVVSTTVKPNRTVADLANKKAAKAASVLNRPLGETLLDLDNCYSGECPLGNLVADAMRAANQAGAKPPDVAMHNNSGLRARLPKGPISYGALYKTLPFDNVMTALDLTGEQILLILEKTVSGRPGNMVVSGMTYSFDQNRPSNRRILHVTIGGQALEPKKTYRVQTIDYLATGGDGQETFKQGKNPVYGDPLIDVVAAYIQKNSPVNPKVEGRITSGQ